MSDRATSARLAVIFADLVLISGTFALALWWNLGRGTAVIAWWPLFFVPPLQIVAYQIGGAYDAPMPGRVWQWLQGAISGHLLLCLLIAVGLYFGDLDDEVPRLAFLTWTLVSMLLVAVTHILLREICIMRAPREAFARKIILIGSLSRCCAVIEHLRADPNTEFVPVGVASDEEVPDGLSNGLPLVPVAQAAAMALELGAGRILLCSSLADEAFISAQLQALEPFPIEIQLVPDQEQFPFFCLGSEDHNGLAVLNLSVSPMSGGDRLVKRIEDLVLGTLILLLIWPILIAVSIAVKLCNGPGPVLYAQRRHGLMGATITVYKFRTMTWSESFIPGPDDAVPPVVPHVDAADEFLNPHTGLFRQAKSGDARVTRLGKFLRSSSLDELPQFFNVIRGEMSIVGPRPHARMHNLQFVPTVPGLMRRHYVKPGITGLAQISGARGRTRDSDDMQRRIALDLQYIREWSLWLDLRIIAATVLVGFINHEP